MEKVLSLLLLFFWLLVTWMGKKTVPTFVDDADVDDDDEYDDDECDKDDGIVELKILPTSLLIISTGIERINGF